MLFVLREKRITPNAFPEYVHELSLGRRPLDGPAVACRPQLEGPTLAGPIGDSGAAVVLYISHILSEVTARWRGILLVKLTVAQLLKIFLAFYVDYRTDLGPPPLQESPVLTFKIFQDVSSKTVYAFPVYAIRPTLPLLRHPSGLSVQK